MITDDDKILILDALEKEKIDGINARSLFYHNLNYDKGYNLSDLMNILSVFVREDIVYVKGSEDAWSLGTDNEIVLISAKGLVVLKQLKEIKEQKTKDKYLQNFMVDISHKSLKLSSQMVKINWWIAVGAFMASTYYLIEIGKFFKWWG